MTDQTKRNATQPALRLGLDWAAWLDLHWARVAAVLAVFLAALLPLLVAAWPPAVLSVYLLLFAYLLHQLEEHLGDRFRRFVNEVTAGGVEAMTARTAMVVNVGLVWIGYLAVLLLAGLVDPGFGLVAAYATLANGLAHVAVAVLRRQGNPGVWTALLLFLPLGTWAAVQCSRSSGLGVTGQVLAAGIALGAHGGIIGWVRRRRRALLRA